MMFYYQRPKKKAKNCATIDSKEKWKKNAESLWAVSVTLLEKFGGSLQSAEDVNVVSVDCTEYLENRDLITTKKAL